MKKTLLSILALTLLCAAPASAIDDGTYYLYNVGAQRWMALGGTDGYTSCFYQYGYPLTLTASGSGYTITGTTYDSTSGLSADGVGKSTSATFTITETAEGSGLYTISSTNGYFGYDSSKESTLLSGTTVAYNLTDDGSDNVHWQILSKADLESRLTAATETNPVDATFYISCPGFNRHEPGINSNWSGLSYANSYYNPNQVGFHISSSTASTFEGAQTLTGMKAGKYTLTCQGFYRAGSNTVAYNSYSGGSYPNNAVLYVGDETCPLLPIYADGQSASTIYDTGKATNTSWSWTNYTTKDKLVYPYYSDGNTYPVSSACVAFDNGLYKAREGYNTINFTVGSSGSVTIGVRTTAALAYDWTAIDNLHLEYLGPESSDEQAAELEAARTEALAQITALYGDVESKVKSGDALTTFLSAIETAKTSINSAEDKEAVQTAMTTLAEAYQTMLLNSEPTDGNSLDYTGLITNPSFETGDMTGWYYGILDGDHGARANSNSTYATNGCDGSYLFNSWCSADNYVAESENQFLCQTLSNLPVGEYKLQALEASNTYYSSTNTDVVLFANEFSRSDIPQHKGTFTDFTLDGIYVTGDVCSLTIGMRSASWFKADNFRLLYLGKTSAYQTYVADNYQDASLSSPVTFDDFNGLTSSGFTYTEIGTHTHGGYPISTSKMGDFTPVDYSAMQIWTGTGYQLGNSTTSVSYTGLPDGYYKISANVRVYDENGDYDGTATGLWLYAGSCETAITTGTQITTGSISGKGFWGNYSVIAKVEDGTLTTGIKLSGTSFNWVGFQDFRVQYIGTTDPMDKLVNLNLTAGAYVPLCMPFDLKPEYFGQTYQVAQIADGQATLVPVQSVTSGSPCVVKATGTNPEITLNDVTLNFGTPAAQMELWGNVYLTGNLASRQWTATLTDGTEVQSSTLKYSEIDPEKIQVEMTVENRQAEKFLDECGYTEDQSTSVIANYMAAPPSRRDQPNIFRLPMSDGTEYVIANMIPGATYTIDQTDGNGQHYAGTVKATGDLRMVYLPSGANIRDLGGWTTSDGRTVRYGRIYRGAALNGNILVTDEDLQTLKDMNIGAEVDLRWKDGYSNDKSTNISALGFTAAAGNYYFAGANDYQASDISVAETQARWAAEFRFILGHLQANRSVYFHCAVGADRTGLLAMMLEGILGFTEGDIFRDYELTSYGVDGMRYLTDWKDRIAVIKALDGNTLRDKFEYYFTNTLGVTTAEIEAFRTLMLTDGKATLKVKSEAQYGTFMAPYDVEIPAGVTAYSTNQLDGNLVVLDEVHGTLPANTPVIVKYVEGIEQQFTGRDISIRNAYTQGNLTGVVTATTPEAGSYVLQCQDGVTGFYQVADGTTVPANRCYLTAPAGGVKSFFFSTEDATAIEALQALTSDDVKIYDVNGRRLPHLMRGVNIVGGKKVIVK